MGFESEMAILDKMCSRSEYGIDIGAHLGNYAIRIARACKGCIAFEPNPYLASFLRRGHVPRLEVKQFALSRGQGETDLFVPVSAGFHQFASATIHPGNPVFTSAATDRVRVEVRDLDSFAFKEVCLIKIDVEGHEQDVLEGARKTVALNHPTFIIESENRHSQGAPEAVASLLQGWGYQGFFLRGARVFPLDAFDHQLDQGLVNGEPDARYVNNFIFAKRPNVLEALRRGI